MGGIELIPYNNDPFFIGYFENVLSAFQQISPLKENQNTRQRFKPTIESKYSYMVRIPTPLIEKFSLSRDNPLYWRIGNENDSASRKIFLIPVKKESDDNKIYTNAGVDTLLQSYDSKKHHKKAIHGSSPWNELFKKIKVLREKSFICEDSHSSEYLFIKIPQAYHSIFKNSNDEIMQYWITFDSNCNLLLIIPFNL
jgi:hypothetical protein